MCFLVCASAANLPATAEPKPLHELQLQSGADLVQEKKYAEGYRAFKKMADGGCLIRNV